MVRGYTDEQVTWLFDNSKDYTREELCQAFNEKFGTQKSLEAIRSFAKKRKLPFKRAKHWADGLSKDEFKSHFTEDAMRRRTAHFAEMNDESRCRKGDIITRHYVPYIVLDDRRNIHLEKRIIRYDRYVWEKYNEPLKPNEMIMHIDGDEFNNDISNLRKFTKDTMIWFRYLISKENKNEIELKETVLKFCELQQALKG